MKVSPLLLMYGMLWLMLIAQVSLQRTDKAYGILGISILRGEVEQILENEEKIVTLYDRMKKAKELADSTIYQYQLLSYQRMVNVHR